MCGRTLGRVVFFGLNITDNIKSAGFAFPGDVSLALNMTYFVCVILNAVKPPRQVAPSPARPACHLSRINGRAYSRKGGIFRIEYYG